MAKNAVKATIFGIVSGVSLPANGAKRGPKENYPFDSLKAPRQIFAFEIEKDAKGKDKADKDGNPVIVKNEDGTFKLAADENGLPIPLMDANGNAIFEYDSFGIKDRTASGMSSTVYSAMKRYATNEREENGKKVYDTVRDFVVHDVDPANDPQGATCRVWRIK